MSLRLSPTVQAIKSSHGGNFTVFRLELTRLAGFIEPIMGFDHFLMSGPTFAPHPHAGFSAVTYVFEDSDGAMRNRDSLGHDLLIGPGEMLWTQAGKGVIHDEFPVKNGRAVHGLQLFVNLSGRNKHLPPEMHYLESDKIPVEIDESGTRTRLLSGQFGSRTSLLATAEHFDFVDVQVKGEWIYRVDGSRNTLIYVISGAITVMVEGEQRMLQEHHALGISTDALGGQLQLVPESSAHILVLSGNDPKEPIAVYGPFIMNTQAELEAAYDRYRAGGMGRLTPV